MLLLLFWWYDFVVVVVVVVLGGYDFVFVVKHPPTPPHPRFFPLQINFLKTFLLHVFVTARCRYVLLNDCVTSWYSAYLLVFN